MAVGDDVLGVLPLLPHKEAGAPPVGHLAGAVRCAGRDQYNAVQYALVKRGGGRNGSHQERRQQCCGQYAEFFHLIPSR